MGCYFQVVSLPLLKMAPGSTGVPICRWPEVTQLKGDDPPNMKPRGTNMFWDTTSALRPLNNWLTQRTFSTEQSYKAKPRWSEVDSSFFEKYVTEKNREQWWNPAKKKTSIDIQITTVDGWNPAPPDMYETLQIMG